MTAAPAMFDALQRHCSSPTRASRARQLATKALADARPDLLATVSTQLQARFLRRRGTAPRRARRGADRSRADGRSRRCARTMRAPSGARGALDYDDLIVETRNLCWSAATPRRGCCYKLDGGIDHVLIDEAQDTSPEQWEIVQQADRGILRRRRARARHSRAPSSRSATRSSPSSASRAPIPASSTSTAVISSDVAPAAEQRLRGRAADAPRAARRRRFCASSTRCSRADAARAGLTSQRQRDRSISAHRAGATGGVEFWPALKPPRTQNEADPWYAPVDAPRSRQPGRAAGASAGRRQIANGWIAAHDPARPRRRRSRRATS